MTRHERARRTPCKAATIGRAIARERRGDAARGRNVEREKQMQILEKITLDDVRASWLAG
jgi:hypothetical protein